MNQPTTQLTREAALEIKRLYEERGPTGKRLYSHRDLARMFACSETTILRVIRGLGSFMGLPTPKQHEQLKREAAESLEKLKGMLAQPAAEPQVKTDTTKGATDGLDANIAAKIKDYGY